MEREIKEIIVWTIILLWITGMSIWLRNSVVLESEKDRDLVLQKICLSEELNGDFAWKIEKCGGLLTPLKNKGR